MPEFLLLFAGKLGVPEPLRKAAVIATGVLLALIIVFIVIKVHDHRVIAAHEAQIQRRAAPATDQAATQRANDAIQNNRTEQDMHNAIAAQPDQPIAPTSHALACERLRRIGRAPASCR